MQLLENLVFVEFPRFLFDLHVFVSNGFVSAKMYDKGNDLV